jgi:hypothetical protein
MSTIRIFNSSRNGIQLATHSPIVTQAGDADFSTQRTRYIVNSAATLSPGSNDIDATFWANWLAANPASSLSRVIYPA